MGPVDHNPQISSIEENLEAEKRVHPDVPPENEQ
jgi:hypothetical protein